MYKESFATRIKEARKKTGFTQDEVAKETGIIRTAISKYERGELEPNIENLGKLANFYDVSIDWLVGLGRSQNADATSKQKELKERQSILNDLERTGRKEEKRKHVAK